MQKGKKVIFGRKGKRGQAKKKRVEIEKVGRG